MAPHNSVLFLALYKNSIASRRRFSGLVRQFALALLFVASLLATDALAQDNASEGAAVRPFAAIHGGDIDHISLQHGGLAVDVPIASYSQRGRGLKLDLHLYYENRGFYTTEICEPHCIWYTNWNGSGFTLRDMQNVSTWGTLVGNLYAVGCDLSGCPAVSYPEYAAQTMDGAMHRFGIVGTGWESVDGSGFDWNSSAGILTDPEGIQFATPIVNNGQSFTGCYMMADVGSEAGVLDCEAAWRKDTNGNKITFSYSSGLTDTMGRSIPNPASTSNYANCTGPLPITSAYSWNLPGPNGGTSPVTLCYATSFVTLQHWGFGGSGSSNLNESVLESVVLPDGKSWVFQYSADGNMNLIQITYPTGATINYTWTHQILCPCDGSLTPASIQSRTLNLNDGSTPAATWNYTYVASGAWIQGESGPPQITTTVSDPLGDKDVHTATGFSPLSSGFADSCSYYETEVQTYSSSGAVLKTVNTTYSYPTNIAQLPYADGAAWSVLPANVTTIWPNGRTRQTTMSYDPGFLFQSPNPSLTSTYTASHGRMIKKQEYDYTNALLQTTNISYAWQSPNPNYGSYLTNDLLNLPYSIQVLNSGGIQASYTYYGYDESGLQASNVTEQKATGESHPGNQTSVHRWMNVNTASTPTCAAITNNYAVTTSVFYDTGEVQQSTDPCGYPSAYPTTYQYSPTYYGAYLTTVTNTLGQSTTYGYDFNTGSVTSIQDPNLQTTSKSYDMMNRLTQVSYPDGGSTKYCYSDVPTSLGGTCPTSPPFQVIETKAITSSQNEISTAIVDGLGRLSQTQLNSDPLGTTYTLTSYDPLGRKSKVYNPTRCSAITTNCGESTWGFTTTSYDTLNRVTSVLEQDNSVVATTYDQTNSNSSGVCTTVTDEAGKSRQSCVDGLGRMTSVWEAPTTTGYNFETVYAYDTLNNLLSVTQEGDSSSSNWRTRSFVYDSLSQLTSATNPESGTILYAYDANGNLATKTAPLPNATTGSPTVTATNTYDQLNRLTSKTYSDGTTPANYYHYDVAPSTGTANLTNLVGRLVTSSNQYGGGTSGQATATYYSYDAMGRVIREWEQTPSVSPNGAWVCNTYDLAGNLASINPAGLVMAGNSSTCNSSGTVISYARNAANRLTAVTSSLVDAQHPATLYSLQPSVGYYANGAIREASFGNGLTETVALNSRLQPCRINVNSSGAYFSTCTDAVPSGNLLDFTMGYNAGTSDNGNVASWSAVGHQTFSRTYTYDPVNRIQSMADTAASQACKGLSWTIDAWGNMTAQTNTGGTCFSFSPGMVGANNQFLAGYGYDIAGNMIYDGVHHYTYDAESRITQVDSGSTANYVYNENGKRARKSTGSGFTEYYYGADGTVQNDYNGTWVAQYVYEGGGLIAEYANNTTHFVHTDHLGSTRLVTALNRSVSDNMDYLPYGLQIAGASGTTHKFTGKERDAETELDNFGARYDASSLGRFMTPDPLLSSGRPGSPQTWNRYSYTLNNPLGIIDPNGLYNVACTSTDAACKDAAKTLKQGLSRLQKKVDKMKDSDQKTRLQHALDAMGTQNDGNNVNVKFSALPAGVAGQTAPTFDSKTKSYSSFTVTFDPSQISGGENYWGIDAAHEGTHVGDYEDPLGRSQNPATAMDTFQYEYRGYQTSAWAAEALGVSPLEYADSNGTNVIWNSSWAAADRHTLMDHGITNHVTSIPDHPENPTHNPWPDRFPEPNPRPF